MGQIMTIEELSNYIKVSERTIYEWIQNGEIPAGKLGSVWRFKKRDIDQWIDSRLKKQGTIQPTETPLQNALAMERILITNYSKKRDILHHLLEVLSKSPQIKDRQQLKDAIFAREALMSTGIGMGLGIPHVRLFSVKDICAAVAVNKQDLIDYEALDSKPVRVVIMVAASHNQHEEYLILLSKISKLFKTDSFRHQLMNAETESEVYDLICRKED